MLVGLSLAQDYQHGAFPRCQRAQELTGCDRVGASSRRGCSRLSTRRRWRAGSRVGIEAGEDDISWNKYATGRNEP